MSANEKYSPRIVIYGIGHVGQAYVRIAADKGWDIVAVYNRAGDKVGQDIGRLCGLERDLGIVVQDCDTADYSSLRADVALVATTDRLSLNLPIYERLLGAGINVLCNGTESYNPYFTNPEAASKIDTLARQHEVTFTGSGIWDMTRIWSGIMVAGPCVEIDSLYHSSATDLSRHGERYFEMAGVGMTLEEFEEKIGGEASEVGLFVLPSVTVLQTLGYTITDYRVTKEPIVSDTPFYCASVGREFPPGITLGTRIRAEVNTEQGVTAISEIDQKLFDEGEIEEMRWKVLGKPGMEIAVRREDSEIAVASSLFNRIPDVIAAKPGLVELTELGPERPIAML